MVSGMKIRELLSGPEKWTQKALARGASGELEDLYSQSAVQWCLMGAMARCYPGSADEIRKKVRVRLFGRQYGLISRWNDAPGRTFEEVRALVAELDV